MSCPGIHCPGCSGGQSLGILAAAIGVAVVAYETVAVVAEYIVPIAVTVAVCFALAVAASMWLERVNERRAAEWGAARGIRSRADVILPPSQQRPAIENHYHVHHHYADAPEGARVIRQALPGAITEEK